MKTITISEHRDEGGALNIGESPWFIVAITSIVGFYNPRWGFDYRAWNAILGWCDRFNRTLFTVPVEHSCEASQRIWGTRDGCYHIDQDPEE
jgi:hypothetical protein